MSVPSLNVTTTCEKPNFETLRIPSSPGRPPIACSSGNVIRCSTSSGPREGATVLICTCTGVVSGNASISSFPSETTPTTARNPVTRTTSNRCRNEKSMIQFSIDSSLAPQNSFDIRHSSLLPLATSASSTQTALQELRLEHHAVLARDDLA